MQLLFGQDEIVRDWVSGQIGGIDFGPATAIGLLDAGNLIAGVVYNNYIKSPSGEPISIEISIASTSKKWCARGTIKTFFAYPFIQLRVKRLQATCSQMNREAIRFLNHIGFHFEGIGRDAWPLGGNCVVYSMLKHECKWIENGKKRSFSS